MDNVLISVDLVSACMRADAGLFSGAPASMVQQSVDRYRKFIVLVQKYPCEQIAPARDIDEVWHSHMLHPVAYYRDCMTNFGEILDHDGGFGSASAEEWASLVEVFENTSRLWQQEFGIAYADEDPTKCVKACRKACEVARCMKACRKACSTTQPARLTG